MSLSVKDKRAASHSRGGYAVVLGIVAMSIAALVAVLALPAIEQVLWRDVEQTSNH